MKRSWVYPLLILAAVLLAYGNSFSGPFIFDDLPWIPENPHIRHLLPLWDALQAPHGGAGTGRPLVCLTLALNYALSGLDPWSYHVANLAIHVSAAFVLFGIVRRTLEGPRLRERFGPHASGLAAVAAICWAVHPLQTESVTYIIQRMESLMGLFLLLTLYCVIRGHDSPRRLIVLVGMSKARGGLIGSPAVSSWRYAQNQFGAIAHYLRLTFWPDKLCLDYGWQASTLPRSWIAVGAILVIWLAAATGWALANAPPLGFLGAWFLLTVAPSSSVFPIQDMVAERRMYLPLAAVMTLTVMAAWNGLSALSRRLESTQTAQRSASVAMSVLIIGALAWRTAERNQDYHSGIAIWTDTIRQRPQNGRAWNNLGYSYYKAGQTDSAVACLRRAIELLPTYAPTRAGAYANLGNVRIAQGRYSEAITNLSEAVRLNPGDADARNDLGCALQQLGDREKAIGHLRTAIRLQPDHGRAHYNLSILLTDLGDFDEALRELQTARRLLPDQPEVPFKLGLLLSSRGRYAEACVNFAEALRLRPDFEQAREHLRLCEEKRHASESH